MAKTNAILGAGVSIGYSELPLASTPVYTKIVNLEDVTAPQNQRDDVEISNHDSDGLLKEWIPGWNGATDPTMKWIFKASVAALLQGFQADGKIRAWQVLYPDGSTQAFTAYIKNCGPTSPRTDKMVMEVTLKIDDSNLNFVAPTTP
ncbi:MAG: hypothetical protein FWD61_12000 [Phycisphaerales bacterium]|nr:hypothetical protein [Phycisphaerales bacterium]